MYFYGCADQSVQGIRDFRCIGNDQIIVKVVLSTVFSNLQSGEGLCEQNVTF